MKLKKCPFCKRDVVRVRVHDDEGNYKGELGCDYENNPWSGLSYAIFHPGHGDCLLCNEEYDGIMGGVLFDTVEAAATAWNEGAVD